VKAALTGHLVLSTIHTNDAPSTLNRLADMGVEPFLLGSAVNLILAQRLVRKICDKCAEPVELDAEVLSSLGLDENDIEGATIRQGRGCYECTNTGYRGRIGVYEVMPISPVIRELILKRANAVEIRKAALESGMISLRTDALVKLRQGVTSAEEVLKETARDDH